MRLLSNRERRYQGDRRTTQVDTVGLYEGIVLFYVALLLLQALREASDVVSNEGRMGDGR